MFKNASPFVFVSFFRFPCILTDPYFTNHNSESRMHHRFVDENSLKTEIMITAARSAFIENQYFNASPNQVQSREYNRIIYTFDLFNVWLVRQSIVENHPQVTNFVFLLTFCVAATVYVRWSVFSIFKSSLLTVDHCCKLSIVVCSLF